MEDAPPPVAVEQVAEGSAGAASETVASDGRIVIDLMPLAPIPERCPAAAEDEIVVCAEDPDLYRYNRDFETPPQDRMDPAIVELAEGVTGHAETEQASVGGFPSNRLMARVKIKF